MKRTGRVVACCLPDTPNGDFSIACSKTKSHSDDLPPAAGGYSILVEVDGLSACARCASGQGCGRVVHDHPGAAFHLRCYHTVPLKRLQKVTIDIEESNSSWLWLVAGAYGLPLLGLIAGVIAGDMLSATATEQPLAMASAAPNAPPSAIMNEFHAALGGAIGLIGGLIAWRQVNQPLAARILTGLCLHTARIVAVSEQSLEKEGNV